MRAKVWAGISALIGLCMAALVLTLFVDRPAGCGEPAACGDEWLFPALQYAAVAFIVSMAAGWLVRRGTPEPGRWLSRMTMFVLCASSILLAAHSVRMSQENAKLRTALPPQVDLSFSAMAIAIRPITPMPPGAPIKIWERCALGTAACSVRPRSVEALCRTGVVQINEADWSALRRVPVEDLVGVEHPSSYQSMKLCDQ